MKPIHIIAYLLLGLTILFVQGEREYDLTIKIEKKFNMIIMKSTKKRLLSRSIYASRSERCEEDLKRPV